MPHFVIHSNKSFIERNGPDRIISCVYEQALASTLFSKSIIKVRVLPFEYSFVQGSDQDFIHIVAWIMGGRTDDQKAELAESIVKSLKAMFPDLPTLSIDVRDINPTTYTNREMVS
ncbi:MAG: 5-carboxymethyl-2-hydroxymuconate Delta-isomerase [Pseudomonadales bacterium]